MTTVRAEVNFSRQLCSLTSHAESYLSELSALVRKREEAQHRRQIAGAELAWNFA